MPGTGRTLCRTSDVPADLPLRVEHAGYPALCVYRLNDGFYVTDDTCTHGDASLSEGDIEGGIIVCPYHQGAFDIRTGRPVAAPCAVALRTYRVRIEDERLFIDPPDATAEVLTISG